jgi:hypothetical protein
MRNWNKPAALISIAVGLVLAVVAAVAGVSLISTVGDVESIESALSDPGDAGDLLPEILTTSTTTLPDRPRPNTLWPINSDSALGDQASESPQPVSILIEAIGAEAPVNPYGINERTGQMDVPRNVQEVAWYQYGPSPGQPGSAVLAAHVDLKSQGPGVFFNLRNLNRGDTIVIGFDDGSQQRFVVEARTLYQKEDLPTESIFSREGPSILTLITCGGGFSEADAHYDSNVVVFAVPVDRESSS